MGRGVSDGRSKGEGDGRDGRGHSRTKLTRSRPLLPFPTREHALGPPLADPWESWEAWYPLDTAMRLCTHIVSVKVVVSLSFRLPEPPSST